MNDLGYVQLSNPNRSLKLVLMLIEIIGNSSNISTTLAKDIMASHSLSQSPQIPRADDPIFDHTIIFVDFMSYPIYDVLYIPWLGIRKS